VYTPSLFFTLCETSLAVTRARFVLIGLAIVACNGGDGGSPIEPVSLQVGGTWSETSGVVFDGCDLLDRLGPLTKTLQLSQLGVQLRMIRDGEELGSGSLTPATGEFVLAGTYTLEGLTISFTQRGRFFSPTHYTAESDITISGGFVTCEARTSDSGVR
jgi:hypothetical protein